YTAGFSGGARVACGVGYMFSGSVAGVIACGAGFPPAVSPSTSTPFVLFGTAGVEDLNYFELKTLGHNLDAFSIPNRIATFDGGHAWAPVSLCTEAIEWMQLQAMKSGRRTRDEGIINSLFNGELAKAKADESAEKVYAAYLDYSALTKDFKGLKDITFYEKRVSGLRNTKEVKSAIKDEDNEQREQGDLEKLFVSLLNGMTRASASTSGSKSMMQDLIDGLKKQSEDQQNTSKRLVARRSLTSFSIMTSEQAAEFMASTRYFEAATYLSVATLIQPNNARLSFNLARAYSLSKQRKEALDALNKAIEKGFTDVKQLESNKDFDYIREDPQFKNLVATLKGKQQ